MSDQLDLSACPYFRQDGSLGLSGPGTCIGDCSTEPKCVTLQPATGWPSEKEIHMDRFYYGMLADLLKSAARQLTLDVGIPENIDDEFLQSLINNCNQLAAQLRQLLEYDA